MLYAWTFENGYIALEGLRLLYFYMFSLLLMVLEQQK